MTKAKPLFNKEFCSQSCPYLTNPSTMTVGGDTAYYYSCSKYPEGWQRLSDPDNIKRCDDCIKASKSLRKSEQTGLRQYLEDILAKVDQGQLVDYSLSTTNTNTMTWASTTITDLSITLYKEKPIKGSLHPSKYGELEDHIMFKGKTNDR